MIYDGLLSKQCYCIVIYSYVYLNFQDHARAAALLYFTDVCIGVADPSAKAWCGGQRPQWHVAPDSMNL